MALIKNKDAAALALRGFEDLGDLRRQAETLLAQARAEAQRILDEASAEAQRLIDDAAPRGEAEGRRRGEAEGREAGSRAGREAALTEQRQRLDELAAAWTAALDTVESGRNDLLLAAREDVVELALALGRRITHRVIEADPSVVRDQVAAVLELIAAPTRLTLTVHPDDRALVAQVMPDLHQRLAAASHVEIRTDEGVTRGGCIVTTGVGKIDATIERQVARIAEGLLGRPLELPRAEAPPSSEAPEAPGAPRLGTRPRRRRPKRPS